MKRSWIREWNGGSLECEVGQTAKSLADARPSVPAEQFFRDLREKYSIPDNRASCKIDFC